MAADPKPRRPRKAKRLPPNTIEVTASVMLDPTLPPDGAETESGPLEPEPAVDAGAAAEPDPSSSADEPGASAAPEPPPDPLAHLDPLHRKLIAESAISVDVAVERGYRSVWVKEELKTLGFKPRQCGVPTLLIPLWGVNGEIAGHQVRRDVPRVGAGGKPLKYEFPQGARMVVDVPRRVQPVLGDPKVPLIMTEGVRKADSAASRGLPCIALLGVWNWRGTNEDGGKTLLPDFESIAFNDRDIYIAFDSDVVAKKSVHDAMSRLKAALKYRGAKVKVIRLPDGPNGAKVGLDDYLASGKSNEELFALAQSEMPPVRPSAEEEIHASAAHYIRNAQGLVRIEYGAEGEETHTLLANFDARIIANVTEDDGVSRTQHFEIQTAQSSVTRTIEVPSAEFGRMDWVAEKCGSTYVVSAGFGNRDHARAAIQVLSGSPEQRTIFLHTGWRAFGADWAFVHGGGAIGARGEIPNVRVRLPEALAHLRLPAPPEGGKRIEAVHALLCLIGIAPDRVSVPMFCAAIRPVLGPVDVALQLTGLTGTFKTEGATLIQQCFGAGFTSRSLPGSWSSTGNALEVIAHAAKDAVVVVDDFVPQGSQHDAQRMHREADRLIRAQGNGAGRQRLTAESALRPTRWPRGLIFSTGEDTPAGQSLRARMIVVEVTSGDIAPAKLTACQAAARRGLYAEAMAAFVRWVAARREGLEAKVRNRVAELRADIGEHSKISHKRTTDSIAQFFVAVEYFAEFCVDVGALDERQATVFKNRCRLALLDVGGEQAEAQAAFDPAEMFVRLLRSALSAGKAHLCDEAGRVPEGYAAESVGWHLTGENGTSHQSRGLRIGWIVQDELYVDPTAAMKAAQEMAEDTGRIPLTSRALGVRLYERGYLASADRGRQKYTTRRSIQAQRHDVLHLYRRILIAKAQEAQQAHEFDPDDGPIGPDGPSHTTDTRGAERDEGVL